MSICLTGKVKLRNQTAKFSALTRSTTIHKKNILAKLQQNNIGFFHTLLFKNNFSYHYGCRPRIYSLGLYKFLVHTQHIWTGLKETTTSGQDWKKLLPLDSTEEMLLFDSTEKHNWFGLHWKHYSKIIYVIDYFCLPVVPGCNAWYITQDLSMQYRSFQSQK